MYEFVLLFVDIFNRRRSIRIIHRKETCIFTSHFSYPSRVLIHNDISNLDDYSNNNFINEDNLYDFDVILS